MLDAYTRRARLAPAFLVVLPIGLTFAAWFSNTALGWSLLAGLLTTCGFTLLLAEIGRDQGKRREQDLARRWGGLPTLRLLRHRDGLGNPETRRRYHAHLQQLLPAVTIPTAEEELADPTGADRVYESCVDHLREKTRDTKRFPLVFQENMSYGFRRNLWAMKPAGVTLAIFGLLGGALSVALTWRAEDDPVPLTLAATVINALMGRVVAASDHPGMRPSGRRGLCPKTPRRM